MFIELLRKRRSIRRFVNKPVEAEKVDLMMEAALRAFSGKGIRPWEFVVVTNSDIMIKLSESKPTGAAFLKHAPMAVAVCVDPAKTDTWVEDAAIASTFLHLAATDLGLGSCWIQLRLRNHPNGKAAGDYAAELLDLRKGLTVHSIVAVGYAAEEKAPYPESDLLRERVSFRA